MEHIPGTPLQQALEAGQLCAHKLHPMVQAFKVAERMLSQISAAMYHVSKRFFHRDVNSHNILVQVCTGQLSFGLIDFGLAVDSETWTAGGWRADLQSEYASMIDLHSAGLSVLQTLVVLAEESSAVSTTCKEEASVFLAMEHLAEVWKQYWRHASSFWQRVLDAFNSDARSEIKMKLAEDEGRQDCRQSPAPASQEMVHDSFGTYFHQLRAALEKVQASLRDLGDGTGGSFLLVNANLARSIIEALLIMISTGRPWRGQAGWREVRKLFSKEPASGAWSLHLRHLRLNQVPHMSAEFTLFVEASKTMRRIDVLVAGRSIAFAAGSCFEQHDFKSRVSQVANDSPAQSTFESQPRASAADCPSGAAVEQVQQESVFESKPQQSKAGS
eukprot:s165_g15.t1